MESESSLAVAGGQAIERLTRSLSRSSLKDFVSARTTEPMLLVDVSGSMSEGLASGERKIDALRQVVRTLMETHPVPVAAFGTLGGGNVRIVDTVPEPQGGTPLHLGIDFAAARKVTLLVVVTDGMPDSEAHAFESARRFGGQIDVFYIGDGNDRGAEFCRELARKSGGQANVTDLGDTKLLASAIAGLLPESC